MPITTRADANKISLQAIRNLFSGARASDLEVAGTRVTCTLVPPAPVSWPPAIVGVTQAEDGPDWPPGAIVDCAWSEGRCRLVVTLFHWTGGEYLHDLCVQVRTGGGREVMFVNVANQLKEIEDGDRAKLQARFFVTKRRANLTTELAEELNLGLRDALQESRLPIISDNVAELCEVEVPSGAILPSPEVAFRRLITFRGRSMGGGGGGGGGRPVVPKIFAMMSGRAIGTSVSCQFPAPRLIGALPW